MKLSRIVLALILANGFYLSAKAQGSTPFESQLPAALEGRDLGSFSSPLFQNFSSSSDDEVSEFTFGEMNEEAFVAIPVKKKFLKSGTIDLTRSLELQKYQGYEVISVTVTGKKLDPKGFARVVLNSYGSDRVDFRSGGQTLLMPRGAVIGSNISRFSVVVNPVVQIETVRVELAR